MPYDEALAERVRRALAGTKGLTEKKMFGGIAFLVDGAMCIGVDKGDLIVRCAKDETEALLAKVGVREFDLSGGRPMKVWLLVGSLAMGRHLRPGTPLAGEHSPEQIRKIAATLK